MTYWVVARTKSLIHSVAREVHDIFGPMINDGGKEQPKSLAELIQSDVKKLAREIEQYSIIDRSAELNIKEETDFFDLSGRDSKWLFLGVNWPKVQGTYYAKIRLSSHNNVQDILKKIELACPNANAVSFTGSDGSASSGSITGDVIAAQSGNSSIITTIFVFLVIAIIAVIIKLIMVRF